MSDCWWAGAGSWHSWLWRIAVFQSLCWPRVSGLDMQAARSWFSCLWCLPSGRWGWSGGLCRLPGWQGYWWVEQNLGPLSRAIFRGRELVMDREACCAAIHGVTKSQTWLSDWTELNWGLRMSLSSLSADEWSVSPLSLFFGLKHPNSGAYRLLGGVKSWH